MPADRPKLPAAPQAEMRIRELAKTHDVAAMRIRFDDALPFSTVHIGVRIDDFVTHLVISVQEADRMHPEVFEDRVDNMIDIAVRHREIDSGRPCRSCSMDTIPA